MRIAVPVSNGRLFSHFGHCEAFDLFDIAPDGKSIASRRSITPPPHEPGILPPWLAKQGATLILAGGMGARAVELFQANGVKVVLGVPEDDAKALVERYLAGDLSTGSNACDH
jgi:predicted Fe-Mo cluster-binding NifX family protein